MPASKSNPKKFRVYIRQVNQTYVEVMASDKDEASEKGYRKWRRDYAHSSVSAVVHSSSSAEPTDTR